MPATIHLKSGAWYRVDAFREDIEKIWDQVLSGKLKSALITFDRLDAGIPLPKVTIDVRELEHVEESRR